MTWLRAFAIAVALTMIGSTAAAAPVVPTVDELAAALLAPEDMPDDGWLPARDATEFTPLVQASDDIRGWCGGPSDALLAAELASAATATTTLAKKYEADEVPSVQVTSVVWETLRSFEPSGGRTAVGAAKAFLTTIRRAATACEDEEWIDIVDEFVFTVTSEVVPFPKVGDQRLALRVTSVTEDFPDLGVDLVVYVRVANHVVALKGALLPAPRDDLGKIAKRAVKKLQQVAAAA